MLHSTPDRHNDRTAEWFVPQFGPVKFRAFIGLLFLPYTFAVRHCGYRRRQETGMQ
jgi:hypothetical protein